MIAGDDGDTRSLASRLDEVSAGTPDLLVTELCAPGEDGPRLLRRAREKGLLRPGAETAVLVLTHETDEEAVRTAFRLGARGFALKSDPIDEIEAAVEATLRGERVLSESLPRAWMQEAAVAAAGTDAPVGPAEDADPLSEQEREVLRLTAQGLTKKEVGRALSISPRAAEKCRRTVQEKLSLGDQVEMVRYAARSGLL